MKLQIVPDTRIETHLLLDNTPFSLDISDVFGFRYANAKKYVYPTSLLLFYLLHLPSSFAHSFPLYIFTCSQFFTVL